MLASRARLCECGSGDHRYPLSDAQGIFCTYVCDECEPRRRLEFRAEVLDDPYYATDEPIDDPDPFPDPLDDALPYWG